MIDKFDYSKTINEQQEKFEKLVNTVASDQLTILNQSKQINNLEQQLDIANKKLEETKEYINKNIRHEYRNGRNNEFYLELNENKLKQLQSIIGSD